MVAFNTSQWKPAYSNVPQERQPLQLQATRERLFSAFAALAATGYLPGVAVPGWNYTNSATLAEASPGSATEPNRVYMRTPGTVTNATVWLKAALTWAGGVVTKAALYYSSDNQASYTPMLDELGFYVVTITYSGADITETSWGAVP